MGDLHQPLHAADDHDAGGNGKRISGGGLGAGNLYQLWDVELVEQLGSDPRLVASDLIKRIFEEERREWSQGAAVDWAMESFEEARNHVYSQLPPPGPLRPARAPPPLPQPSKQPHRSAGGWKNSWMSLNHLSHCARSASG